MDSRWKEKAKLRSARNWNHRARPPTWRCEMQVHCMVSSHDINSRTLYSMVRQPGDIERMSITSDKIIAWCHAWKQNMVCSLQKFEQDSSFEACVTCLSFAASTLLWHTAHLSIQHWEFSWRRRKLLKWSLLPLWHPIPQQPPWLWSPHGSSGSWWKCTGTLCCALSWKHWHPLLTTWASHHSSLCPRLWCSP